MKILFRFMVIIFIPSMAYAWQGNILKIHDGDTLTVAPCGDTDTPVDIRLYGVDSPELGQPGGTQAVNWLRHRLPLKTTVDIIPFGTDTHGRRVVAIVMEGRKAVNAELIQQGLAWVSPKFCRGKMCAKWKKLEKHARKQTSGIWSKPDPVPPWEWRKSQQSKRKK